jgi:hypothetical protein
MVASPFARHAGVSHVHVSQAGVMHTIELILGLRPLSAYSELAPVPYDLFTSSTQTTPFTSVTPTYPADAVNPPATAGTASAIPVDVSRVDVAGPVLEAQLWEATRRGVPLPAPLVAELRQRGHVTEEALDAWLRGKACSCETIQAGASRPPRPGVDLDD